MVLSAPARPKINTEITQLASGQIARRGRRAVTRGTSNVVQLAGNGRDVGRVEVGLGIVVYPPEEAGLPWRAVSTENGRRRYRQAMTEPELAVKLEKVKTRLAAGAPNMERPGADLIAWYLDPDRLPARQRWSRRHADTQARLCSRFAVLVIAAVTCQDITTTHMQQIVNAAPTASEGDRLHRCLSALVTVGINAGYLTSPQLARVHWQAAGRPIPDPQAAAAGESPLWVDPAEIPALADVDALAHALGYLSPDYELMANTAAYTGLRQGELFALSAGQLDTPGRVITIDRKLIDVAGQQYVERPKNRKTIYPRLTPSGYPLAELTHQSSPNNGTSGSPGWRRRVTSAPQDRGPRTSPRQQRHGEPARCHKTQLAHSPKMSCR